MTNKQSIVSLDVRYVLTVNSDEFRLITEGLGALVVDGDAPDAAALRDRLYAARAAQVAEWSGAVARAAAKVAPADSGRPAPTDDRVIGARCASGLHSVKVGCACPPKGGVR